MLHLELVKALYSVFKEHEFSAVCQKKIEINYIIIIVQICKSMSFFRRFSSYKIHTADMYSKNVKIENNDVLNLELSG